MSLAPGIVMICIKEPEGVLKTKQSSRSSNGNGNGGQAGQGRRYHHAGKTAPLAHPWGQAALCLQMGRGQDDEGSSIALPPLTCSPLLLVTIACDRGNVYVHY